MLYCRCRSFYSVIWFIAKIRSIEWGLEIEKISKVNNALDYQTNIPGFVYAIGDVNTYPGKIKIDFMWISWKATFMCQSAYKRIFRIKYVMKYHSWRCRRTGVRKEAPKSSC
jgi:hypothetical protein